MASLENTGPRVPVAQALGLTVGEVMIAKPKTLPATVLVRDVRAVFGQPSHRTVLLTDDGVFRGSIERERLPADADDDEPAARYAEIQPVTATPGMPIPEAVALLERQNEPRLIVLDDDGLRPAGTALPQPQRERLLRSLDARTVNDGSMQGLAQFHLLKMQLESIRNLPERSDQDRNVPRR